MKYLHSINLKINRRSLNNCKSLNFSLPHFVLSLGLNLISLGNIKSLMLRDKLSRSWPLLNYVDSLTDNSSFFVKQLKLKILTPAIERKFSYMASSL